MSAEENQSRRETDTLLTNTEEGGTEQGGGTDGPSWRHRGRRKRSVPLSPGSRGFQFRWQRKETAEMGRQDEKAGREGRKRRQDPTDAADRRGLLSGRTGGGRRGIPAGKGERERGTRGFLGQVSAGLHVSDQKSSLNRKTALNKILDHSKVQSAPGASA